VGEAFCDAHVFRFPATIDAIIHGARQTLENVGMCFTQYVFESRPGETLPDNRRLASFG